MMDNIIFGKNSVQETILNGAGIDKVYLQDGSRVGKSLIDAIKKSGISYSFVPKEKLDKLAGNNKHQGIVAVFSGLKIVEFNNVIESYPVNGKSLFVLLSNISDIGNLGAIIRSAAGAGAQGVIFSKHDAAVINPKIHKTSAGCVNRVDLIKCGNMAAAIKKLKELGFWIYGLEGSSRAKYYDIKYDAPAAVVLGAEDKGIAPGVRKTCDELITIPMENGVESLNVSAAAAIVLFRIKEFRNKL